MAETVADQDLSGGSQKRKRGAEHGSPDSRRSKRGAPAASMANPDNLTSSFMDSGDAAASASVNLADFNALQAAAASDHPVSADPANVSSTAAAALNYPTLSIPQSTEETFAPQGVDGDHGGDASFNTADMSHNEGIMEAHPTTTTVPASVAAPAPVSAVHAVSAAVPVAQQPQNGVRQDFRPPNARPAVGSEEWHKIRKDNHKEVERRRRETINEGINELSKIVPGCEKNKGSILQRAVAFITQLKENEAQNIEKWTLEKLLTEQAIAELSASNDKLKQECDRLYRELETWKRVAQAAGVEAPKEEPSAGPVSSSSS